MKPWYKRTEFWVTVGTHVALWLQDDSMPAWAKAIGGAVAAAGYAISRGMVKGKR